MTSKTFEISHSPICSLATTYRDQSLADALKQQKQAELIKGLNDSLLQKTLPPSPSTEDNSSAKLSSKNIQLQSTSFSANRLSSDSFSKPGARPKKTAADHLQKITSAQQKLASNFKPSSSSSTTSFNGQIKPPNQSSQVSILQPALHRVSSSISLDNQILQSTSNLGKILTSFNEQITQLNTKISEMDSLIKSQQIQITKLETQVSQLNALLKKSNNSDH